ncbi:transcriptional regulator [Elizabethkingia anophelis]|uniref:helix-turn-helix domain-containing protein n=1 Tax=Elizabethkingia anophelis TaxID=1117645 RepID=UPI0005311A3F|nr:helix-turn-helix transcriptional regulator [Elizabethkingia anophelis]KGT08077.1 transcriptional regulator [Elizabethkingia anophelis]MDV3566744.1 transcriptional regulator [Elizabethkingia anophelis]MDV3972059.1 transcriptional regulator [Elizabethkingia anophelis]OPC43592.1 transcriptional regulator [Elizabethkingia anophelis]
MTHTDMPNKKIHQGRNIKRFREMLGIKQDALAYELGEDWNQKKISLLEQKESVEKDILEQVAKILKVPTEAIENFDEEQAVNLISCTFSDNAMFNNRIDVFNNNPIDEIRKLHEEKIVLFERMLKEKDDMMTRLEKLIQEK